MATTVLKRLLDQRPCFGTFVKLGRPEIVDICALAGFDFVICDMEHAQMTEIEARSVIRACVAADLPVVVRLPEPEQGVVNRLLEAGAQGIQLPRLTSAEQSRRVRAMLHFPPAGRRSVGNANPLAGYGTVPLTSYMDQANDRALVVGRSKRGRSMNHRTRCSNSSMSPSSEGPISASTSACRVGPTPRR